MANRVKEVSAFNGTSWGAAVPLGANDSNIDITSSTTQPDGSAVSGVTGDSATALNTSAVAVSEGDTGASAWTKFNRFRKRVANNFANYIQGSIATSYNATGSNSAVYSTNVLNNYMSNVIGYSGTTTPSAGTVAAQLSSLNDKTPGFEYVADVYWGQSSWTCPADGLAIASCSIGQGSDMKGWYIQDTTAEMPIVRMIETTSGTYSTALFIVMKNHVYTTLFLQNIPAANVYYFKFI